MLKGVVVPKSEEEAKKGDDYKIAQHIVTVFKSRNDWQNVAITRSMTRKWGSTVTLLYLLVKLLFVVNILLQFYLLNAFLNPSYTWWGFGILGDLFNGRTWDQSGHFPRVTMCDVEVRTLGNLNRWTVQCVLVINMFNEKIYLFLWFWFFVVGVMTVFNFIYWAFTSFRRGFGKDFIARYLHFEGVKASEQEIRQFIQRSVHRDGITVLRLLSANCGDIVTSQIVYYLWALHSPASETKWLRKCVDCGRVAGPDATEESRICAKCLQWYHVHCSDHICTPEAE